MDQVSSRVEYPEDYHTFSEEDRRDFRHVRYGTIPNLVIWFHQSIFAILCSTDVKHN